MKDKPKVVFHGSQYLFDTIAPQHAHGRCETESQMGIYAAATMDEVIPFALPFRFYPDEPGGKLSRDSDGINSYLRSSSSSLIVSNNSLLTISFSKLLIYAFTYIVSAVMIMLGEK